MYSGKMTSVFGKNTHYYINNPFLAGDFDFPPEKMASEVFPTYSKTLILSSQVYIFQATHLVGFIWGEREGIHKAKHKVIVIAMFVIVKQNYSLSKDIK